MTTDPRMQGKPVVRPTPCRIGGHVFVWAGVLESAINPAQRCACATYSYQQWMDVNTAHPAKEEEP